MPGGSDTSAAKRALITGATSYIGLITLRQLLAAGWQVQVLARSASDISRLADIIVDHDILRMDGTAEQLNAQVAASAPDVVFHFASLYLREPAPDQVPEMIAANYTFGVQLLEALRLTGNPVRFVNTGTGTQYFHSATPRPLNLYAASKQAFTDTLAFYAEAEGFQAVSLILFDTFGPEDWRIKLLNAMFDALAGDRVLPLPEDDAELDLLYIDDAAAAFVLAGEKLLLGPDEIAGGVYALSSGERRSISDIVRVWENVSENPLKVQWGGYDLPERRTTRLWQGPALPGWKPLLTFEQGLKKFLAERP